MPFLLYRSRLSPMGLSIYIWGIYVGSEWMPTEYDGNTETRAVQYICMDSRANVMCWKLTSMPRQMFASNQANNTCRGSLSPHSIGVRLTNFVLSLLGVAEEKSNKVQSSSIGEAHITHKCKRRTATKWIRINCRWDERVGKCEKMIIMWWVWRCTRSTMGVHMELSLLDYFCQVTNVTHPHPLPHAFDSYTYLNNI